MENLEILDKGQKMNRKDCLVRVITKTREKTTSLRYRGSRENSASLERGQRWNEMTSNNLNSTTRSAGKGQ